MKGTQEICKLKIENLEEFTKQVERVECAAKVLMLEKEKLDKIKLQLVVIE